MNKLKLFHVNKCEIQFWLAGTIKNKYDVINFSIPEEYFEPYLSIVNSSLKKPDSDTLFISLVMTSINNNHVVKEAYLIRACDLISQKIIKEIKKLNEISGNNTDFTNAVQSRKLNIDVLKEELGILKYVLDTKQPYPERIALDWDIRFLDEPVTVVGAPMHFVAELREQAQREYGERDFSAPREPFPDIDMDIEVKNSPTTNRDKNE